MATNRNRIPESPALVTFSARSVARMLGVTPRTVRRLARDGRFPRPLRVGRQFRWPQDRIEAWLAIE
jgi:excisionase family DNA binding protein